MFDSNTWRWQCVSDPTAEPDHAYPGDFYGGFFRKYDLEASRDTKTWPEGITFRNVSDGKTLIYLAGQLVAA